MTIKFVMNQVLLLAFSFVSFSACSSLAVNKKMENKAFAERESRHIAAAEEKIYTIYIRGFSYKLPNGKYSPDRPVLEVTIEKDQLKAVSRILSTDPNDSVCVRVKKSDFKSMTLKIISFADENYPVRTRVKII